MNDHFERAVEAERRLTNRAMLGTALVWAIAALAYCAEPAMAAGEPVALNGYCRTVESTRIAFEAAHDGNALMLEALDTVGHCNMLAMRIPARLGNCTDARVYGRFNRAYRVCEVFLGKSRKPLYWYHVMPGESA